MSAVAGKSLVQFAINQRNVESKMKQFVRHVSNVSSYSYIFFRIFLSLRYFKEKHEHCKLSRSRLHQLTSQRSAIRTTIDININSFSILHSLAKMYERTH
jgi:hypothetical protein